VKHIKTIFKALVDQKQDEKKPTRQRDEYDFLPAHLDVIEKPPAPRARLCALVLTVFLISVVIWSVFGRLDIHAGAQGRLMVSSHSNHSTVRAGGSCADQCQRWSICQKRGCIDRVKCGRC